MQIGLIIYGRLDTLTGGWIYDRLLVEHLREQGHTVEVISLKQHHYVRNLADNFSRRFSNCLLDQEYGLLLQDGLIHPSVIGLNRRIKRRENCLIVSIVHQVLSRQPLKRYRQRLYQAVEQRYFNSVDGFIFNSETTGNSVKALVGRQPAAVVAYPGGDRLGSAASDAIVESRARRSGPLQLIFVGNLTPNKGLLPLIAGLSRLARSSWHLSVVGSLTMNRAYVKKVRALIERLELQDRIDIQGPLDGRDLTAQLEASQVFALPFSYEGFGIACLEAMAWGLPVIGSTRGALREFVCDGINGALIPPGDMDAFARQIERLHSDRGLLTGWGREALNTFRSRPRWRDSFQKIHSFLLSMAV